MPTAKRTRKTRKTTKKRAAPRRAASSSSNFKGWENLYNSVTNPRLRSQIKRKWMSGGSYANAHSAIREYMSASSRVGKKVAYNKLKMA